jgi:hypothetical protein
MQLLSQVPGFEGKCTPTWLNTNTVDNRMDGGVTGFFKLTKKVLFFTIKTGEEFHGIIKNDVVVEYIS